MHAQEIAILDRRLKDDPRGIPYPYETDELKAVCAQSRDENARGIAARLLRQRGQDVPEHAPQRAAARPTDGHGLEWRAQAEMHHAEVARERDLERARELLRSAGEL